MAGRYDYKLDRNLQAQLLREIEALIQQQPANSACADCSARLRARSAFCSVTLGIWLCNRCYGVHRSLGTHVSRTKCVGLDAFSREEVRFMAAHGDARAAHVYEAAVPAELSRPTAASGLAEVEAWARAKYERKAFCREARPARAADGACAPAAREAPGVNLIDFGPTAASAGGPHAPSDAINFGAPSSRPACTPPPASMAAATPHARLPGSFALAWQATAPASSSSFTHQCQHRNVAGASTTGNGSGDVVLEALPHAGAAGGADAQKSAQAIADVMSRFR
ncbi:hypothetical protein KFE25_014338 [Diacronema lutheri]|uniref:Arf-GAP domain-containing protein n=1 Tax=Diacronema lutheri TaxID=2081491 RepID=A0A8J5XJJ0_DIALT|nr:hypothetical protein KFE25_014338 [Diacronema lutheri]